MDNISTEIITQAQKTRVRALRELFLTLMWMGHRQMVRRMQAYDLSHPQFITLASLAAHSKPASMRDLTEVTFQDAPTMTRIVDRLVTRGWARRTRDSHDRRVVLVEATEAGHSLIEHIKNDLDREDELGFSVMSDEELTSLEDILDVILSIVLRRQGKERLDLEYLKAEFRGFANDPIGFIKTQKASTE